MIRPKDLLDDVRSLPTIECGVEAKEQFAFADDYINLNHGSFGTYSKPVNKIRLHYQDAAEARPDKFIRYDYPVLLDMSRDAIAAEINAPVDAITFVPNATTGINTVLRALEFEKGDVILYFATIYGACEHTVTYITEITPAESRRLAFQYPISDAALCDQFEALIKDVEAQGKKAKIAVFDTIVSLPGVRMPFERLTELCRKYGVMSCIDGAHSVGQIDLDLSKLDPDFFVSNCHKWLHTPRGCAVFYVPVRNQHLIRSTIPTSHGFVRKPVENGAAIFNPLPPSPKSAYTTNFEFVGTIDNSPYLCIPAALEWRQKVTWKGQAGDAAIKSHNIWLANAAADLVAEILGTEVMQNEEKTLTRCSMANVRLPLSLKDIAGDMSTAIKVAQWIAAIIVNEHNTFIAIFIHGDAWWIRLSGQVYLTIDDFKYGGKVLHEVCERVKKGEWRA